MNPMTLTIPFEYYEDVIPPRCRKSRPMKFKSEGVAEIERVDKRAAGVAFIQYERDYRSTDDKFAVRQTVYRWYNEQLWTKGLERSYHIDMPHLTDGPYFNWNQNKAEALDTIRAWASRQIIIGDETWLLTAEPRYVVMTFGLGHNHGGTALMTDNSYNSNIAGSCYYAIDQREEAIAAAETTAMARGDTKNVPIHPHSSFRIFNMNAVRLNPQREHPTNGDEFINGIERTIRRAPDATSAGLLAIFQTMREISK